MTSQRRKVIWQQQTTLTLAPISWRVVWQMEKVRQRIKESGSLRCVGCVRYRSLHEITQPSHMIE